MSGAARSGKDTVATILKSKLPHVGTFAFATLLKETAAEAFHLDYRHLYGKLKESEVEVDVSWRGYTHNRLPQVVRQIKGLTYLPQSDTMEIGQFMDLIVDNIQKYGRRPWHWRFRRSKDGHYIISSRRILQLWGTEIMRGMFGDTLWTDITLRQIQGSACGTAIITDMRFPVEVKRVKEVYPDAKIFHVVRPGQKLIIGGHSSEAGLPEACIDQVIMNDGTLADLESAAMSAVDTAFN